MTQDRTVALSVCIPTARRPHMVRRLLQNLAEQTRVPDEILVVDASPDDETARVVEGCQALFPRGVLRRIPSALGLTQQRNVGIDHASGALHCMIDDDVLLEPDCIEVMQAFMDSPQGQEYGGIGAYVTNEYGRPLNRAERCFGRLGIYESLEPGTWLYCGDFIEVSRLQPFTGVRRTDFLSGCVMMWRQGAFEYARPDNAFQFYGEDKHLSLRVGQQWAIGVLGHAHIQHHHCGAERRPLFGHGLHTMRNRAIILRDCDPTPSVRRYVAHIFYQPLELARLTALRLLGRRPRELPYIAGLWVGWLWNALCPPRASRRIEAARQAGAGQ